MALEDFTTFTEFDDDAKLTVVANRIDFTAVVSETDSYVAKDFGAGYWGDFVQRLKIEMTSVDPDAGGGPPVLVWGMTNIPNYTLDAHERYPGDFTGEGFALFMQENNGAYLLVLNSFAEQGVEAPWGQDIYDFGGLFTAWCEIERNGTAYTCKIYSDAYSTLVDTLSLVVPTTTYRYLHIFAGAEYGVQPEEMTGYIENMTLVSGGNPLGTPHFESFASYNLVNLSGELNVASSTKVEGINLAIDEDVYLATNFGAGYFGDFAHRFKVHFEDATFVGGNNAGQEIVWQMTASPVFTLTPFWGIAEGFSLQMLRSGAGYYGFSLYEREGATDKDFQTATPPYDYYIEMERAATTLTAKFYDDIDYTNLATTLSLVCATTPYQYLTPLGGLDVVASEDDVINSSVEYLQRIKPFLQIPREAVADDASLKRPFSMTRIVINNMTSPPSTGMGQSI